MRPHPAKKEDFVKAIAVFEQQGALNDPTIFVSDDYPEFQEAHWSNSVAMQLTDLEGQTQDIELVAVHLDTEGILQIGYIGSYDERHIVEYEIGEIVIIETTSISLGGWVYSWDQQG